MEKVGIFFRLQKGKEAEYERLHARIPDGVSSALTEAGIVNYTIWRRDDLLFAYYETQDPERAGKILGQNESYLEWRKRMRRYVFETPDGQNEWFMKKVFSHD